MKFRLIFIPILFFIIEINQIKIENKKLPQKSFDEIFGEKWQEKEEEKRNELKKREIIGKFYKIKEKIKQKGRKYSTKEWNKIDGKIAKKMGTNRTYIQQWIKEFGLQKSYKSKSDEEKRQIIQKFIKMKNEFKQKRKYSLKEWHQNYEEIGKKIGVGYQTIKKWKKQFGIRCRMTEKEKMEKMKIYWQIKKENPKMSEKEIAKTLEIHRDSILKWKKQFGIRCRITEKEKMEKMKKYWKIKRENPKMSDKETAKILQIDRTTISKWKKQFGGEILEDLNG